MKIDEIFVGFFTISGIIFTYWYFLMRKEEIVKVKGSVDIVVKGGYNPETISIPVGKTTKINFLRKDANPCLEEVVLGDFKVKKFLPMNEKIQVEITPKEKGQYPFSCGMNMFHGKIIVE